MAEMATEYDRVWDVRLAVADVCAGLKRIVTEENGAADLRDGEGAEFLSEK
jgi:hypothetical protein